MTVGARIDQITPAVQPSCVNHNHKDTIKTKFHDQNTPAGVQGVQGQLEETILSDPKEKENFKTNLPLHVQFPDLFEAPIGSRPTHQQPIYHPSPLDFMLLPFLFCIKSIQVTHRFVFVYLFMLCCKLEFSLSAICWPLFLIQLPLKKKVVLNMFVGLWFLKL